jgi:hypothetical protein
MQSLILIVLNLIFWVKKMLDIPSISAIIAAVGVTIGVVLTVLEIRNLVDTRQTW